MRGMYRALRIWVTVVAVMTMILIDPVYAAERENPDKRSRNSQVKLPIEAWGDALRDKVFPFLDTWSASRLQQLSGWRRNGIVFEGPWRSDEVMLVLDVLEIYRARIGEARFLELVDGALRTQASAGVDALTFVRKPEATLPTAGWLSHAGEIAVTDSLFDGAVIRDHYPWVYPAAEYDAATREHLIRRVTIAHELGHVIADGLRAERIAVDEHRLSLENRYAGEVQKYAWPHPTFNPNENLATEIALWALEEARPDQVLAFSASYLAPAIASDVTKNASQR